MNSKVIEEVRKTQLLKKDMHIVLGLSGGPDSVCLFDILMRISREMNITLYPVHINHKIRRYDAETDQQYVESLCKSAGVECESIVFDCKKMAKDLGMTTEEAGRKMRYDTFRKVARDIEKSGIEKKNIFIATAHNADDQGETILMRLIRGTGIDGIVGIEKIRNDESGYQVIRPLHGIYKKDILEYCNEMNLHPCVDKTNETLDYARNKIRLELIPYLEKYNPNIKVALYRLSESASDCVEILEEDTNRSFADNLYYKSEFEIIFKEHISKLSKGIFQRVIKKGLWEIGLIKDVTSIHYKSIWDLVKKGNPSGWVDLPQRYRGEIQYGRLRLYCLDKEDDGENLSLLVRIIDNESYKSNIKYNDGKFKHFNIKTENVDSHTIAKGIFDYDIIAEEYGFNPEKNIVLRSRSKGDFISIGKGRKKIQNLLVDEKVPRTKRDMMKMVAIGREILMIPYENKKGKICRYSNKFRINDMTKKLLIIEIVSKT